MKAGPEVFLEHERLDVYRAALDFDALASKAVPRRGHRVMRDQLDRASIGIVLCMAACTGRRSGPDRRRFYELARGSATESAAILDILQIWDRSVPKAMLRLGSLRRSNAHANERNRAMRESYLSCLALPSRGRYRGRGRACVSDPTRRNKILPVSPSPCANSPSFTDSGD